ncbi:MAG TPA: tetratricopeptide repeat protein [Opitutaceae bacterium]
MSLSSLSCSRALPAILAALVFFVLALAVVHAAADAVPSIPERKIASLEDRYLDIDELRAAAEKGEPEAQEQYGEMLLRGDDEVKQDEFRAVELLERAARAGRWGAAYRLGMLLTEGKGGLEKDPSRAIDYFRAAAVAGDKQALYNLGAAYASGRGVKRDYGEALAWFILARKNDEPLQVEVDLRKGMKSVPAWIARGERRAREIVEEVKGRKVTDFLPPPLHGRDIPIRGEVQDPLRPALAPELPRLEIK